LDRPSHPGTPTDLTRRSEPGGRPDVDGLVLARGLLGRCRFPPGDGPVVAAVSGGADSLALLVLARAAGRDVLAVHVDHGLRTGSAEEADVVADAAVRFGARFERRRVAVEAGPDLEARARRARYQALPAGVMTGHTADDQAETVLLNVMRGAALDGLAGMRDGTRVRRPLLDLRRAETHELCAALDLHPVDDPSNADLRFRRNRVRHQLLPLLGALGERDAVPILARQAEFLADDAALLESLAAELDPTDVAVLAAAPLSLTRRALRRWLRDGAEQHPPSAAELERVLDVVGGRAVACEVSGGRRVWRSRGRLYLGAAGSVSADMERIQL
jgi:tRNA(Ile)-lysidine synthase